MRAIRWLASKFRRALCWQTDNKGGNLRAKLNEPGESCGSTSNALSWRTLHSCHHRSASQFDMVVDAQLAEIEAYLLQAMRATPAESDGTIMEWVGKRIEPNVPNVQLARLVVRSLLEATCAKTKTFQLEPSAPRIYTAIRDRAKLLRKFMQVGTESEQMALMCSGLYEVQDYCARMNWPKMLMKKLFYVLYAADVVLEEAFGVWRDDTTDESGHKRKGLVEVNEFLGWLDTTEEDEVDEEAAEEARVARRREIEASVAEARKKQADQAVEAAAAAAAAAAASLGRGGFTQAAEAAAAAATGGFTPVSKQQQAEQQQQQLAVGPRVRASAATPLTAGQRMLGKGSGKGSGKGKEHDEGHAYLAEEEAMRQAAKRQAAKRAAVGAAVAEAKASAAVAEAEAKASAASASSAAATAAAVPAAASGTVIPVVRFIYRGESLRNGRVCRLAVDGLNAADLNAADLNAAEPSVAGELLLQAMRGEDANLDLARFAPFVYSQELSNPKPDPKPSA